jgi:hypothetical protein
MKRLSLFEITVISFLISIVASTGIIYLIGNDSYITETLNIITLRPIFDRFIHVPAQYALFASFGFLVAVFTFYLAVVGLILQRTNKFLVLGGLGLLVIGIGFDQKISMERYASQASVSGASVVTSTIPTTTKKPQQYFGKEAIGDIDNDGKDDVAFIIMRNDKDTDNKNAYYLSAALTVPEGKQGTNLLFLGAKVVPENIAVENGVITIGYLDSKDGKETKITASLKDGVLVKN